MLASELIKELQRLVDDHGDLPMAIDSGEELLPLDEVDISADETEDCFILWWE
jgi:hypothetical protein